jgi:membrane-associated phospholipid phosphatase
MKISEKRKPLGSICGHWQSLTAPPPLLPTSNPFFSTFQLLHFSTKKVILTFPFCLFQIGLYMSFLLPFTIPLSGQYTLQTGREAGISGAGLGLWATGNWLVPKAQPFSEKEIASLDAADVWKPDRWVTRQWSIPAQKASDKFLFGSLVVPAALYLDSPGRAQAGKIGLITLESYILNAGLTTLTKKLTLRPRPYLYNVEVPLSVKQHSDSRYSFFSGHTSFSATAFFLSAKLYNDLYPDSNGRPYVWATAAAIPAITGYLRVRGGKHYLTDVLAGYAVGALIGILVPEMHR